MSTIPSERIRNLLDRPDYSIEEKALKVLVWIYEEVESVKLVIRDACDNDAYRLPRGV